MVVIFKITSKVSKEARKAYENIAFHLAENGNGRRGDGVCYYHIRLIDKGKIERATLESYIAEGIRKTVMRGFRKDSMTEEGVRWCMFDTLVIEPSIISDRASDKNWNMGCPSGLAYSNVVCYSQQTARSLKQPLELVDTKYVRF